VNDRDVDEFSSTSAGLGVNHLGRTLIHLLWNGVHQKIEC
jgi:hypothetical protein